MRRRSVLGSLLALLAAAPKAILAAESTGDDLESEFLRELRERQQQTGQSIETLKSDQEIAQQEVQRTQRVQAVANEALQEAEDSLYAKIEELQAIQFEIDRLQVEIFAQEREISRQEDILADEQEIASDRLRAVYKLSRVSPLEVILTASSFSDALNRITLFRRILGHDVRKISATQERTADLDAKRAALLLKKNEMDALKRQREEQRAELEWLQAEKERRFNTAAQAAAAARQQNANLRQEIAIREAESEAISAEIEAELERIRSGLVKDLPQEAASGWFRPAGGWISAGYGVRTWLQAFHSGIDYAVAQKSPVIASQSGRVVKVGYAIPGNRWSSYGMMVVIQHSWHETSFYAHLDDSRSMPIKKGDPVHKGQTIGWVGMTGFTSGPHLHFEIRWDNVPDNPNKWLR